MTARHDGVPRYPNGRKKPPTSSEREVLSRAQMEDNMSVVLAQRAKMVDPKVAESRLAGTMIGRMFLRGEIDRDELRGAQQFLAAVVRWSRLKGLPPRHAPAIDCSGGGRRCVPDPDDDAVREADEKYYSAFKSLRASQRDAPWPKEGPRKNLVLLVDRFVIEDEARVEMNADDLAALRHALRALFNHFESKPKAAPIVLCNNVTTERRAIN